MDKLRVFSNKMKRERRRLIYDGRQQSTERYDKQSGHHRSPRPGHVFKGVTRELERAQRFPVQWRFRKALIKIFPVFKATVQHPLNKSESHPRDAFWNHKQVEHAWYQGRKVNSEQTWDGLWAVLADHSTEDQSTVSDREGGEVTSKRPTVGKEKLGIT